MGIRELSRPIRRRVGRLVVAITADGVELSGYRCRRSRLVTWSQIASLSGDDCPIGRIGEIDIGERELLKLNADPAASVKPITAESIIAEPIIAEPFELEPLPERSAKMADDDYWPCACVKGKAANLKIKLNHKSRKRCGKCNATRPETLEGAKA